MLRIKADKWQEFCERAEELGFEKDNDNDYCFSDFDPETEAGDMNIFVDSEFQSVNYFNGRNITEHKLFDLITMGFVEKVEE